MKNILKFTPILVFIILSVSSCDILFPEPYEDDIREDEWFDGVEPGEVTVEDFIFTPVPGAYNEPVDLTVSNTTPGLSVYFTYDGTLPTVNSEEYREGSTEITIYNDITIKVVGAINGEIVIEDEAVYSITNSNFLEHTLSGNYTNTTGSNPVFNINQNSLDSLNSELNFDSSGITTKYNSSEENVIIGFKNLNVYKDGTNYYLRDVIVEEFVDGEWIDYIEFIPEKESLTNIAVALVLDKSSSLGSSFSDVQNYANQFVSIVKNNSPDAKISIIDFGTTVSNTGLIDDTIELNSYINNLTQQDFTKLYDGINRGHNILNGYIYPKTTTNYTNAITPYVVLGDLSDSTGPIGIRISEDSTFSTTIIETTTIDKSVQGYEISSELEYGKTFYWQFYYNDSWNSSVYTFTTVETQGTALVSFTDGRDSGSNITSTDLISNLNGTSTKCFTIGLEGMGGVNSNILESLAVNGNSALAESVTALEDVFENFSQAVSNVYNVSYKRSSQVISSPREIRFKFLSTIGANSPMSTNDIEVYNPEHYREDFESGYVPGIFNGEWLIDSESNNGFYSLRSNRISHSQSTAVELIHEAAEAGTISFYRKVSSESSCDFLKFYIDGSLQSSASWSGDLDWAQETYNISPGAHTYKWEYSKDVSIHTGTDAAWIDDIVITW